jgi:hypothetical protein
LEKLLVELKERVIEVVLMKEKVLLFELEEREIPEEGHIYFAEPCEQILYEDGILEKILFELEEREILEEPQLNWLEA